jgi:dihydroorotase
MSSPDLVIRHAQVIDPASGREDVADIMVSDGRITGIGVFEETGTARVIDARGMIASPGWIDLHAHLFSGASAKGLDPDSQVGIATGVTTVVDAGTCGLYTWNTFRDSVIDVAKTRVLAFLNVSMVPTVLPKHGDWSNFSQGKTIALAEHEAQQGRCVGIKVLASQTHCGNLGTIPVELARQAARLSGTKLMVHIGNAPPVIEDTLSLLDEGDIVTHCWHGKFGGLLGRDKKPLPETWAAVERGVRFDIGHGSASFSFETARYALDAGLPLHAISTDLHGGNVEGPVYNMATTMTKLLHIGVSLPEVIRLSTQSPAELIDRCHELGSLAPGREADITLFRVVEGDFELMDSEKRIERASRRLVVTYTIRAGEVIEVTDHAA